MSLDHPQHLRQPDHDGGFITSAVLLRARQGSSIQQLGLARTSRLRRPRRRHHGFCDLGLCLPLHLHRLGPCVQHHHVHWYRCTAHVIHGVHWHCYLETTPRPASSSIEDEPRQGRVAHQHRFPLFLRRCLRLRVLPTDPEPPSCVDELGDRCVWRCAPVGLDLLHFSCKARICGTGRYRQEDSLNALI